MVDRPALGAGAGGRDIWPGRRHAEWTRYAVDQLAASRPVAPLVWGGDWNHAISGRERAGSNAGREAVLEAVDALDLQVPTAPLAHRLPGLLSIDHVAVPTAWTVTNPVRVMAQKDGTRLSDHDMYVVSVEPASSRL